MHGATRQLRSDVEPAAPVARASFARSGISACAFHSVVLSAVELLIDPDRLARVRECPGEGCGWFFFDSSRNGLRHWCSMKTCGNAEKVRRFRAGQRGD